MMVEHNGRAHRVVAPVSRLDQRACRGYTSFGSGDSHHNRETHNETCRNKSCGEPPCYTWAETLTAARFQALHHLRWCSILQPPFQHLRWPPLQRSTAFRAHKPSILCEPGAGPVSQVCASGAGPVPELGQACASGAGPVPELGQVCAGAEQLKSTGPGGWSTAFLSTDQCGKRR